MRRARASTRGVLRACGLALVVLVALLSPHPSRAADAAFAQFIASVWPEAQRAGVSRATFDAATAGLEPDTTLPDLELPGRKPQIAPQAEFVQVPADYLKEASIARLAATGRELRQKHHVTLDRIERELGVPGPVILAIWARETDFGRFKPAYGAIRTLATQAFVGRRREQLRNEFVLALKMVQDGYGSLQMRSS